MSENCWFCLENLDSEDLVTTCKKCGVLNDREIYKPLTETEEDMPNLGDLKNYLKTNDLQQEDIIMFVNAGEIKDIDFSKTQDGSGIKTVFQILIELPNAKNKIYTPNATTREILGSKWGKETSEWVNKKAKVSFVKQLAFGKMIDVLVLEPIE